VADLGLIGLAVMGQNLALNFADRGHTVAVHNRSTDRIDEFMAGPAAGNGRILACARPDDLVAAIRRPRRIVLMVKAGPAVDAVIDQLAPLLEEGDIVIDGGNSNVADTERRVAAVAERGLRFVGAGVSGGEEGARTGPSIMPGGDPRAASSVVPLLQSVAAVAADGRPCCDWLGPGGAGHFVKMVHNGIEYGDMQIIAEAYALLSAQGLSHDEMSAAFSDWGRGRLDSYLIDITADILATADTDGQPLVARILDVAGQKGTGRWTVISAMELAQPVTLVGEAVNARILSAMKEQRVAGAGVLTGPSGPLAAGAFTIDDLGDALYGAKVVSYAQGFLLLAEASRQHDWGVDLATVASLWRAGCIIRAALLEDIMAAFADDPGLDSLLVHPTFAERLGRVEGGWRRVVAAAVTAGIPVPANASALAFYDGYRRSTGPANLIQAQRDYFGAHTYERIDRARGQWFHTDWTGRGGDTTSGSYNA
jgi:6-phosphogluconate dehydrogenase